MIARDMRLYDVYAYGEEDEYGQAQLSKLPIGKAKVAINIASQSVKDSIAYSGTQYIGLTNDTLDDTCVIDYEGKRLKVLYCNPHGRLKQLYLGDMA